jgi:hypothetical protein
MDSLMMNVFSMSVPGLKGLTILASSAVKLS